MTERRFKGESAPIAHDPILRGVDLAMDRLVREDCFTDRMLRVLDELRAEVLGVETMEAVRAHYEKAHTPTDDEREPLGPEPHMYTGFRRPASPEPQGEPTDMLAIPRPHVPFGPLSVPEHEADATYLDHAASSLEGHYEVGGSNVRATVVKLLRDTAAALRAAAKVREGER